MKFPPLSILHFYTNHNEYCARVLCKATLLIKVGGKQDMQIFSNDYVHIWFYLNNSELNI